MTLFEIAALFVILAAMAALPSSSVALVVARSAMFGISNGIATALGIVAGDLVFIAMAVLGMTVLAEQMGALFVIIKYAAATYLIWFGITLVRSQLQRNKTSAAPDAVKTSSGKLATSFSAGLLLTLGDVKAILFYASLLPTFVDLAALTMGDIFLVSAVTVVAVGGVKIIYAIVAKQIAGAASSLRYVRQLKICAGSALVAVGGYLALKA
ncbi:MAG: LysE family translocator [Pseudomonadota bacterium]